MVTSAPILWITCGSEVTRWRRRPSDASWRRERASQPGTRRTWATLRVTLTPTFSRKIRCYSSGYSVSSSNSSVYSPDITRIILNTQQNMALYFFIYWTEAVRALACLNENWHLWVRISLSLSLCVWCVLNQVHCRGAKQKIFVEKLNLFLLVRTKHNMQRKSKKSCRFHHKRPDEDHPFLPKEAAWVQFQYFRFRSIGLLICWCPFSFCSAAFVDLMMSVEQFYKFSSSFSQHCTFDLSGGCEFESWDRTKKFCP